MGEPAELAVSYRPSAFGALRNHQFRLIWLGLASATLGSYVQQFGLGWLVVQLAVLEGVPELAPFYVGLVGLARGVPALAFSLLGGVLADRMDRRKLLIIARVSGAGVALALALLVMTDQVNLGWIMALTFLSAMADSIDLPTRQAMVPRLLPERDLLNAQGLTTITFSAASILGPLLGGLLITPIGVGGLMAVKTVAYLIAVAALIGVHPMPMVGDIRHSNVAKSLRDGLIYVASDPLLRWVIIMSAVGGLLGRSVPSLMPAVAENTLHVGPAELSWLLALTGVGALIGSVIVASLGDVRRRGLILLGSLIVWGFLVLVFAAQRTLVPALLLVGLPSIPWFIFAAVSQVVIQVRAADNMRGRASSLYAFSSGGVSPLGVLVVGSLGSALGDVNLALAAGGVVMMLVGAFVWARVGNLHEEGRLPRVAVPATQ